MEERLIFFSKGTIEQFEEAMSKVDVNKLIKGTVDFGSVMNLETGKEEFFYKALATM